MSVPLKKLNDGSEIPFVGLGTYKANDPAELKAAVKAAVSSGYRHFDCAHCYYNEEVIGEALKESIAESNGTLKREHFYIVSKCWNTYHSKERVELCLDQSLKRFGFDYLDLFLIHWPMGFDETGSDMPVDANGKIIPSDIHYTDTYRAMEDMVKKGKTKSIGLSNFNIQQTKDILAMCSIRPVCNQFEVNPYFHNDEWVNFMQSENIAVVAYAPVGAPDRPWLKQEDPVPLKDEAILAVAKKHNKSPAQVILRWLIQRDIVIIPKSANPGRIAENISLFDFTLSDEDMAVFRGLKQQFRFYQFDICDQHPFYPFKQ